MIQRRDGSLDIDQMIHALTIIKAKLGNIPVGVIDNNTGIVNQCACIAALNFKVDGGKDIDLVCLGDEVSTKMVLDYYNSGKPNLRVIKGGKENL